MALIKDAPHRTMHLREGPLWAYIVERADGNTNHHNGSYGNRSR